MAHRHGGCYIPLSSNTVKYAIYSGCESNQSIDFGVGRLEATETSEPASWTFVISTPFDAKKAMTLRSDRERRMKDKTTVACGVLGDVKLKGRPE